MPYLLSCIRLTTSSQALISRESGLLTDLRYGALPLPGTLHPGATGRPEVMSQLDASARWSASHRCSVLSTRRASVLYGAAVHSSKSHVDRRAGQPHSSHNSFVAAAILIHAASLMTGFRSGFPWVPDPSAPLLVTHPSVRNRVSPQSRRSTSSALSPTLAPSQSFGCHLVVLRVPL